MTQSPRLARSSETVTVGDDNAVCSQALTPPPVPAFKCRKSDQADGQDIKQMLVKGVLTGFPALNSLTNVPGGLTAVHRAEFYDVLVQKLASTSQYATHTSKRLLSYSSSGTNGPITLTFADGTTAEADVVIGSDGLRSATRANMYEALATETGDAGLRDHIRAKFSGLVSYRTVIPRERLVSFNPNHRALCGPVQVRGRIFRRHAVQGADDSGSVSGKK